jgi:hypothetical protein
MQASESIIAHDAVTEDVVGAVTRVRETNQRHRALKESGNICDKGYLTTWWEELILDSMVV